MSEDVTSFQVRAELEDRLERDLLGPWDGPEEELPPGTSPAERYLLGRLVPRERPAEQDETDDGEAVDAEETDASLVDREVTSATESEDDEAEADATVRSGSMAASAIGLAFIVPETVDVISVAAAWGRYVRAPSEQHETPQGRPATTWHRVQAGGSVELPIDAEGTGYEVPDPEQEAVVVRYTVRHRGTRRVVELALVNGQRAPARTPDVARLYQVGLTVTALDGNAAIFLGHNDPETAELPPDSDAERLHLELLHRDTRQYANGRQCAVDAVRAGRETGRGSWRRRASLRRKCRWSCPARCRISCWTWRGSGQHGAGAGRPGQGAAAPRHRVPVAGLPSRRRGSSPIRRSRGSGTRERGRWQPRGRGGPA